MSQGRHVQQRPRSGIRRFFSPLVLLVCGFLFASAGAAFAYFSATGTGAGSATANTLAAPGTGSIGTPGAVTLPLSWGASSNLPASGGPPLGYEVLRSTTSGGETQVTTGGCAYSSTSISTTPSCIDSGLTPNTAYYYKVETVYDNWVSLTNTEFSATTAKQATTTTLSDVTPTSGTVNSTSFSATATVSGNSGFGTPAGTVVFSLYSDSSCSTSVQSTPAQTLSGGQVTGSLTPTTAGTYYWGATYTPTDTYNLTSNTCDSTTPITVGTATFTITSDQALSQVSLPLSVSGGALTYFGDSENVTFHLDSATGPILTSSPNPVTTDASGAASGFSISIPSATSLGSHTIVAVGNTSNITATSNTFNVTT